MNDSTLGSDLAPQWHLARQGLLPTSQLRALVVATLKQVDARFERDLLSLAQGRGLDLSEDDQSEVAEEAILALMVGFDATNPAFLEACWQALENGPLETLRERGAAGLGSALRSSCSKSAIERITKTLYNREEADFVRYQLYLTIHEILGYPELALPYNLLTLTRQPTVDEIDWDWVAAVARNPEAHRYAGGASAEARAPRE